MIHSLKSRFAALSFMALIACVGEDYQPMTFSSDGQTIVARGAIDAGTLDRFLEIADRHPAAKTLVLEYVEGSVDDEANLIFSREVRARGFATHVPSQGLIASGGTDLFLAGTSRSLAAGACVGVHSWGGDQEGRDVPKSDPIHQEYLDYYDDIGIAGAFYWFTLEAAGADDMHWMTRTEANQFAMTTSGSQNLGSTASCNAR